MGKTPPGMGDARLASLLARPHMVAVVGLSDKPGRPSDEVASYLQAQGWRIIPIHPMIKEWRGRPAHASLKELPDDVAASVEIVDVFRKSEDGMGVAADAMARWPAGGKVFWMQLGAENAQAAAMLRARGWDVVENRCLKIEQMKVKNEGQL